MFTLGYILLGCSVLAAEVLRRRSDLRQGYISPVKFWTLCVPPAVVAFLGLVLILADRFSK